MQSPPRCLISTSRIHRRVRELASQISTDFREVEPILVLGVLTGAWVFMADLVRCLDLAVTCDFVRLSSYGNSSESSGTVKIESAPRNEIAGRHVLIVEDIVDTGTSLEWLLWQFSPDAETIHVCTLLDKPSRRIKNVNPDYVGFEVPDEFVVGYGIDKGEDHRSLPYIGTLDVY